MAPPRRDTTLIVPAGFPIATLLAEELREAGARVRTPVAEAPPAAGHLGPTAAGYLGPTATEDPADAGNRWNGTAQLFAGVETLVVTADAHVEPAVAAEIADAMDAPWREALAYRAVGGGVRHIIYVGEYPVSDRAKRREDALLDAYAAVVPNLTIVRHSPLMQLLPFDPSFDFRDTNRLRTAAAEGRVAFVDARDVAQVLAVAVLDPTKRGRELTLTGEDAISFARVASILAERLKRSIVYDAISPLRYRRLLRGLDLPRADIRRLANRYASVRADGYATTTSDVSDTLGQGAVGFATFALDSRTRWLGAGTQILRPGTHS